MKSMIRNERWNTVAELKRLFPPNDAPDHGAGPVLFDEYGRLYVDDSEAHIAAIGNTGKGKTQCVSLPMIREMLRKGESGIILDPKKEAYTKLRRFIPEGYQVFCVDLREPSASPHGWNPLSVPLRLYRSEDPADRDHAADMISELWAGVYPCDGSTDRFWPESAANFAKGLTYALFEVADGDDSIVNLDSVAAMMEQSETRIGPMIAAKQLYDMLPENSIARRNLASYVTAPNDTRASIHSVASNGIEVFSRSRGLMTLLADDGLNVMDMDFTRPFVLFICVADESRNYHSLAGLLVSQMSQQLIRRAQELGGRLPVRVNIVLEELGSVGRSIPNLPNLMAAGRSRNIRILLLLQDEEQLADIFGVSAAKAIRSCLGVQFCFSTNSWNSLTEWSRRCGERIDEAGQVAALVTAAQLSAMPTGTALIFIGGRYKIVSALPPFHRLYGEEEAVPAKDTRQHRELHTYDMLARLKEASNRRIESMLHSSNPFQPSTFPPPEPPRPQQNSSGPDIDDIIARIDAKIAALEKEEEEQKKAERRFRVVVHSNNGCERRLIRIVRRVMEMGQKEAGDLMRQCPYELPFADKEEAERVLKEIRENGGLAILTEKDDE